MATGFPLGFARQRIGLLGGSFDPAHEGHLRLTAAALKRFRLDRVWWLVSPGNPLKAHGPAPLAARVEAARALIDDPRVIVTDLEARLGTRMTADTLAALQSRYPGVRFVWLMGSDNLVQFDRWDRWREIAARVPIGVVARPSSRLAARVSNAARAMAADRLPQSEAASLALRAPPAWVLIDMPMSDASSSAIRARLGAGRPDAGRPEATRPEAARPNAGRPDAERPEAARPDGARPEAARLNAAHDALVATGRSE